MKKSIDINCDLGEGYGNDSAIMPLISSCNIACGGHFGNLQTMQEAVASAMNFGVKVGAHPSFPDKANFGRKPVNIKKDDLVDSLVQQIGSLKSCVENFGGKLHHVKPHGSLYSVSLIDSYFAQAICNAMACFESGIKLYVAHESELARHARKSEIDCVYEGFADRNYASNGFLVPRDAKNALLTKEEVADHVLNMVVGEKIRCIDGSWLGIVVDTVCVHGDHVDAVNILQRMHEVLQSKGISVA